MSYVYAYGMISASTVYRLDEKCSYPKANEYAELGETLYSVGGEAVNSAIILSKLGVKTKLDGNWLDPKTSDRTLQLLKPFSIDTSRLKIKHGFGTEEFVITDKTSRTVFGNYQHFHDGVKQWNNADEGDLKNSATVMLDPYFKAEAPQAAELCVKHCIPYVTLDCKYDSYIAKHAAALVISHELRDQAYPDQSMHELFERYQEYCDGLIIFSFGSDDLWFSRKNQKVEYFSPYQVDVVDTTGAGDSFRAGITYGLMNGWSDEETVRFASAVAACVCMTIPHTLNAPDLDAIQDFINQNH